MKLTSNPTKVLIDIVKKKLQQKPNQEYTYLIKKQKRVKI